jgi:predicted Zn-dependent protease with MMP-like domain
LAKKLEDSGVMDGKKIIMNYTLPPSAEDMEIMAGDMLETLPDEILRFCEDITIEIEDFPDASTEAELELEDSYELLALFKSGKEISPGVEKKIADGNDVLVLYRRAVLDLWCETCEDLGGLIRHAMIEELGRIFDFSDDEIDEMAKRHYQGML